MTVPARRQYLAVVEFAVMLLLLIYPSVLLGIKGGMNGVFLLVLLLALVVWVKRPDGLSAVVWQSRFTIYVVSMVAMSVAILVSQAYFLNFAAHPHDAASRYWLAIPVFLLLQRLRPGIFSVLQYAFPLAAITGFVMAKGLGESDGYRSGIDTLDLIHFGDFELLLAALSLLSIGWFGKDGWLLRGLKLAGCAAGLSASIATGSRGGWLSIPLFVVIFLYASAGRISLRLAATGALAVLLAITGAYFGNATFHQRANDLANDVIVFEQGNRDTSTGIRLQLYSAAVEIFARHPIFGVGPEGFAQEMKPMTDSGKITPLAAQLGRGEVHNDILSKAVGMGIFGLVAILSIYIVPFRLFWQATKSDSSQIRRSGLLGAIFISGFFVFGWTVEFLNLTLVTAFYSFTVAVLLAACYNIHHRA